jgi:hypothetical protein
VELRHGTKTMTDYGRLLIQAHLCTFSHHQYCGEISMTTTVAALGDGVGSGDIITIKYGNKKVMCSRCILKYVSTLKTLIPAHGPSMNTRYMV